MDKLSGAGTPGIAEVVRWMDKSVPILQCDVPLANSHCPWLPQSLTVLFIASVCQISSFYYNGLNKCYLILIII